MGIGAGLANMVTDIAQGVAPASNQWPQAQARAMQLKQSAAHDAAMLDLSEERIKQAKLEARLLAEYRGTQINQRNIETEISVYENQLDEIGETMRWAADHGGSIDPALTQRRQALQDAIGQALLRGAEYHPVLEDTLAEFGTETQEPSKLTTPGSWSGSDTRRQGPVTTHDTQEVSTLDAGMAAPVRTVVPEPGADTDMYAAIATSARAEHFNKVYTKLRGIARDDPEAAYQMAVQELGPNATQEDLDLMKAAIDGSGTWGRYASMNWESGTAFDQKTGRVVNLYDMGLKRVNMTKAQRAAANTLQSQWRTVSQIPKLYFMGMLSKDQGWSGYNMPSGAGDFALLYAFAKIMAPDDSAVREGELQTMQGVMGFLREKSMLPDAWTKGTRLVESAKQEVWMVVYQGYLDRLGAYINHGADYATMARYQGLEPEWVVPGWNRLQGAQHKLRTTDNLIGELGRLQGWKKRNDGTEWNGTDPKTLISEIKLRTGTRPGMKLQKGLDFYIDLKTRLPEYERMRREQANQGNP